MLLVNEMLQESYIHNVRMRYILLKGYKLHTLEPDVQHNTSQAADTDFLGMKGMQGRNS